MEQIRSFPIFLSEIADGDVAGRLTDELRDLIQALRDAALDGGASKGSLTLKVDLRLDRGAFDVETKIDVKAPKRRFARSVFWPTADGLLSRRDPRQQELGLRDVATGGEIRTIAS